MSKTINQFLILFAIIIGTFGKLLVHSLDVGLHFKDMLKSNSASCITVRSSLSTITWGKYPIVHSRGTATTPAVGCCKPANILSM